MNNKKGFTLIELLAVLVLLVLIALIAFPAVTNLIKGAKKDTSNTQMVTIERALDNYIAANADKLKDGDEVCVEDLKKAGLLVNKDIIDPETGSIIDKCFTINWDDNSNQFIYSGGGSSNIATFITGPELNEIILEFDEANRFAKASSEPDNKNTATLVSTVNSPKEIYVWYNSSDNTIYWWSDAAKVYLNPDSSHMFEYTNLESIDLRGFNTKYVTDISYLTNQCNDLSYFNISDLDLSNVNNYSYFYKGYPYYYDYEEEEHKYPYEYEQWYYYDETVYLPSIAKHYYVDDSNNSIIIADNLVLPYAGGMLSASLIHASSDQSLLNFETWDTSHVVYGTSMLSGLDGIASIDLSGWNTSNMICMDGMFYESNITNLDLSSFDVENTVNMDMMFFNSNIENLNFSNKYAPNLKGINTMFNNVNIKNLDLSSFNAPNLKTAYSVFGGNIENLDLSGFNTSNIVDMSYMFNGISTSVLDLSSFNTSKVTNMSGMFQYNDETTKIIVSDKFVTTNVENGNFMFYSCNQLEGGNGTRYDVEHVNDSSYARIDKPGQKGYFTAKSN